MTYSFTAIDFETAQGKRSSICQVGLVRVENGKIIKKISILVRPPDNFYCYHNTRIHGITPEHTCLEPTFAKVWEGIKHYIENQTVVAHNGAFDFNCLKQTLAHYNLKEPVYQKECTYRIYGQGLSILCKTHNIQLNHHDALSDAMACAELYALYMRKKG